MMNRLLWTALCLLLIPVTYVQALGAPELSFHTDAVVSTKKVLLSDIASITPENGASQVLGRQEIASSPAPGQSKTLHADAVINGLRHLPQAASATWSGAESTTVSRKAIQVDRNQLYAIIADFLAQNKEQLPEGDIRFTSMRSPSQLLLPSGDITWKVTPSHPSIAGSSAFTIHFRVNGEPAVNCTVRGKVEVMADVVVAMETIRRGDGIRRDQIRLARKNILALHRPIYSPQQLIGMEAGRTIGKGKVIREDYITLPPVIESGQLVMIVASKGNMKLSTKGVARTSGLTGELIRVKNLRSNKVIHARVNGPGIVSVEF